MKELLKPLSASIERKIIKKICKFVFKIKNKIVIVVCFTILKIENQKNTKRNKVLFNSIKDYTIKVGTRTSYAILDTNQNKIIIPKDRIKKTKMAWYSNIRNLLTKK